MHGLVPGPLGWTTQGLVDHLRELMWEMRGDRKGVAVVRARLAVSDLPLALPPGQISLVFRSPQGLMRQSLGVAAAAPQTQVRLQATADGHLVPDPQAIETLSHWLASQQVPTWAAVIGESLQADADGAHYGLHVWLPRIWLEQRAQGGVDAVVLLQRTADPEAFLAEVATALRGLQPTPQDAVARPTPPELVGADPEWLRQLRSAIEWVQDDTRKLVLARRAQLHAEPPLQWPELVLQMARNRPNAWIAAAAGVFEDDFCCATPELLVTVDVQGARSMAMAGTAAQDAPVDAKLAWEHDAVVQWVQAAMVRGGAQPVVHARKWVQAGPLRHLSTPIESPPPADALPLAIHLHPTPALLGIPRRDAMAQVLALESRHRQWYGGFAGILAADGSGFGEVAVLLRGMATGADCAYAWAGAGLVHGSDPDGEDAEISNKLASILQSVIGEPSP